MKASEVRCPECYGRGEKVYDMGVTYQSVERCVICNETGVLSIPKEKAYEKSNRRLFWAGFLRFVIRAIPTLLGLRLIAKNKILPDWVSTLLLIAGMVGIPVFVNYICRPIFKSLKKWADKPFDPYREQSKP